MRQTIRLIAIDPLPAKVIVGVSGGADSVALLRLLSESGIKCIAAHCNFHLRGEESNRDEAFVRNLCKEWKIPTEVMHFDTTGYAAEQKISIEMAARELRYDWFEVLRREHQADAVAVAHHSDDAVETMLLNLLRGTGIRGLSGMSPVNGYIIRPLLETTRAEIENYLTEQKIGYIHDSSNSETIYIRNKIRLELLPLMEQINPSVKQTLLQTAGYLRETEKVYASAISKQMAGVLTYKNDTAYISLENLKQADSAKALLFEILSPYGFNSAVITSVFQSLDAISGKQFLSNKYRVVKDREYLIVTPLDNDIPEESIIVHPVEKTETTPALSMQIVNADGFVFPTDKNTACFDAAKITFPLTLRPAKRGDYFYPFGMRGRKKLSDYFNDKKYSLPQKEQARVLCSGEDIIWITGERSDNRFRVDAQTREVLVIQVI